ncbi:hypothetical protein [Stieleria maiorica]|uniref:hypothetical protein n=1 Tax=Stieleria maiorica TaxID=2795974 RepID=UPI0011C9EDBB|nr:hypothetical protein [Stieleria maiorica]
MGRSLTLPAGVDCRFNRAITHERDVLVLKALRRRTVQWKGVDRRIAVALERLVRWGTQLRLVARLLTVVVFVIARR